MLTESLYPTRREPKNFETIPVPWALGARVAEKSMTNGK